MEKEYENKKIKQDQVQNKLNEELREDLLRMERYLEQYSIFLPLAVFTVNPLGIIVNVNRSGEDLSGYNSTELIGKKIEHLFKEEKTAQSIFSDLLDIKELKERELTLVTKEQKEVVVRVSTSTVKDEAGEVVNTFWALSDVSGFKELQQDLEEKVEERTRSLEESRKALMNVLEDTREAQKQAEEEKERTQSIINSLPDGLIVLDEDNRIISINPEAERVLRVRNEQIKRMTIEEISDKGKVSELYDAIGGEVKWKGRSYEVSFEGPSKRYFEVNITPMSIGEEIRGMIIVMHDITREKELQKIKTEFVSIAAHQLRTPLSAIKWSLDMILEEDMGKLNEEQKQTLQKTYSTNGRLIDLINDLLNVTRIEEGRYLYETEKVDIENLIEDKIESLSEEMDRKEVNLEFQRPSETVPKITMDKEKIGIAIKNLLENAVKYTKSGGSINVELIYKEDQDKIRFSVEDDGVGIPENQKSEVFSKFTRGDNVERMDTEGTGLGLFMTKNIVEAHNGMIWFESKEGKGTTFYIVLPVDQNESEG